MAISFSSVGIPLVALATFGGVYVLTPAGGGSEPVSLISAEVETSVSNDSETVSSGFRSARVARRPVVPEYTYSEQRKLEGASQVATDPDISRENSVYYSGCREARAAGAAPLYRGDPGYRSGMDGDNDGVACEPHRGR